MPPASSCPPPPSRPQSAQKLQQQRLEQDSGKAALTTPAADCAQDFFKLRAEEAVLSPSHRAVAGRRPTAAGPGGLASWFSRRPGQGCSQVAALPVWVLRDKSCSFPAA